jgi:beta-barrel assembly-enhancing protease
VKGVICKVAPDRCDSIRLYIVDIPHFNASMFPNGAMQVWTGLLLRVRNEAQLAFVLGHEISHYTHRHTIDQYRRIRNTATFVSFFSVAAAGAGVGVVGLAAQLTALAALMSYSRDEEREADAAGFDLAVKAGYEPSDAGILWKSISEEEQSDPLSKDNDRYFSTHPEDTERMQTLNKRAAEVKKNAADAAWQQSEDALHKAITSFRPQWFEEELTLGKYERSLCLLHRLAIEEPDSALIRYYIGEVHRRRNGKGDSENALAAYRQAIDLGAEKGMPAATWRGLGLVAMKSGDKKTARDAFTQYLAAAPQAGDRAMVELYLTRVQE